MYQSFLSGIYPVLIALGLRVAVTLAFYVAGALFRQRWATYGNLDIAINRLFRVLPRWAKVLLALTVVATVLALSAFASALAMGVALGVMIYLVTTATTTLRLPSNAEDRITSFPMRELAGLPNRQQPSGS